ncbi:MAG TPA: ATP-binding protein [Candidatus Acidoferrales bacterium]|nr:ATP-binding protein [Candidatus Acidoferrales bacterium]
MRLRQVLINLVGNALKFTQQGEVTILAELSAKTDSSMRFHFTIADTGIGIALDKQRKIFEAFAQANMSTTRRYGGTGLGLSISERLVKLMNGRIWLESDVGKGSKFHFERGLPAGRPEDNIVNQRLISRILEKMGHTVAVANDGATALVMLSEQELDLIAMDMQMPLMDGLEATQKIRLTEAGTARHIPIVFLSSRLPPTRLTMTAANALRRVWTGMW